MARRRKSRSLKSRPQPVRTPAAGPKDAAAPPAPTRPALGNDGPPKARIERPDAPVVVTATSWDSDGKAQRARVYRSGDILIKWLRAGEIGQESYDAGRGFQRNFAVLGLDPLRAADLLRQSADGHEDLGDDPQRVLDARAWMGRVMQLLGGHGAPCFCALWYVLGTGLSIKDWARRERWGRRGHLNEHVAKGLLIGALATVAAMEQEVQHQHEGEQS